MKVAKIAVQTVSGKASYEAERDSYQQAMVKALMDAGKSFEYIQEKVRQYHINEARYVQQCGY